MSTGLRFTLEVDGLPPDAFAVVSFHLNQSLSSLFSLDLSLVSQQFLSLEFAQVLDKMAYLTIWQGDEVQRRVKGVVPGAEDVLPAPLPPYRVLTGLADRFGRTLTYRREAAGDLAGEITGVTDGAGREFRLVLTTQAQRAEEARTSPRLTGHGCHSGGKG